MIKESGINLNETFDGSTYLETFLAPTQLYVKPILALKKAVQIKGMNHITGGGFYENIPRGLPEGLTAKINIQSFPTPKVFDWLQQQARIQIDEMYNVFNMGIGYTVIVEQKDVEQAIEILKQQGISAYKIGDVIANQDKPIILEGVE